MPRSEKCDRPDSEEIESEIWRENGVGVWSDHFWVVQTDFVDSPRRRGNTAEKDALFRRVGIA